VTGPWLPLLIFVGIVLVVAAAGVRLGMLLAPRIDRWAERAADPHEDDGGDDD
jgi:NADH:ubiquinone oxidoreductase subunit 3 (subunit A)